MFVSELTFDKYLEGIISKLATEVVKLSLIHLCSYIF